MEHFINDYREPTFKKVTKQNKKVKEVIRLHTVAPNSNTILIRKFINIKDKVKEFLKVPKRIKLIRLSNHLPCEFSGKKELNANIVTEIRIYKGIQKIRVKTDINNRYLQKI